jgi:hypothetical protein
MNHALERQEMHNKFHSISIEEQDHLGDHCVLLGKFERYEKD